MRIGVPRQDPPERRVPLPPETITRLIRKGHTVLVGSGAGAEAGWADEVFIEAGAEISDHSSVWGADLVVTVTSTEPSARPGAILGLLRPFDDAEAVTRLAATGAAVFAFEALPRTTRAQAMDVLSSQATVAGYQAVLEAAQSANRFFPMMTTAAGTIPPAKVLVLGAGVAGLQAIATARRLGAVVTAFDVRSAAAEQVRSLGATFLAVAIQAQDEKASGGYATEVAADEQAQILAGLAPAVAAADVIVTTAAIPGRPAPLLITTAMVKSMRPGSVIVDLAATTGGNCEATSIGETIVESGVTIVGATDLESRKPADASRMFGRNAMSFIELITGAEGQLAPDWDDEIVAGTCIARSGQVVHPRLTGG